MKKIFSHPSSTIRVKGIYYHFFEKLSKMPLSIIFPVFLISLIGFVMMYSAAGDVYPWSYKQINHFFVGVTVLVIVANINVRFYYNMSYYFYFFSLLLLIYVELFGYTAMGATRWINLGFTKVQPSDFMKISMIFVLARYYHDIPYEKISKINYIIVPLLLIIVPVLLIIKQPDLGTAMLLLFIAAGILFVAGISIWVYIIPLIILSVSAPFIWKKLHLYQQNRIMIFLDPDKDPLGAGYNISQSKIAIGSAGLFGKGFMNGSQSQLNFLPERQTDFVFTMFAEEWGMLGCVVLFFLYFLVIFKGFKISLNSKNHFSRIFSFGAVLLIFIHVFINCAMVMGLVPVVGIPLPLMSYGGTIMISTFLCLGMVVNAHLYKRISVAKAIKTFI
jgi:rod shape determining protein RodA